MLLSGIDPRPKEASGSISTVSSECWVRTLPARLSPRKLQPKGGIGTNLHDLSNLSEVCSGPEQTPICNAVEGDRPTRSQADSPLSVLMQNRCLKPWCEWEQVTTSGLEHPASTCFVPTMTLQL